MLSVGGIPAASTGPLFRRLVAEDRARRDADRRVHLEAIERYRAKARAQWNREIAALEAERASRRAEEARRRPDGAKGRRSKEQRTFRVVAEARQLSPIDRIILATARHLEIAPRDIAGPSRRKAVVYARRLAIYVARRTTDRSLQQIGRRFGNLDHTTVLYAVQRAEDLARLDQAWGAAFAADVAVVTGLVGESA